MADSAVSAMVTVRVEEEDFVLQETKGVALKTIDREFRSSYSKSLCRCRLSQDNQIFSLTQILIRISLSSYSFVFR
ncbi:hypothetical protein AALP_AA1G134200 [Arabis alpina]|uniref:Uncharacterized protein n=1 Tax=Arabis alpina TaxID=50452 RepID=A0A087HN04_ARAAL|nr:hypothetical protein AALP_AA1G134200 [Arabis alpina]